MTRDASAARALLFVPGHCPDRFAKAAASGADLVVLDLEDAVPADDKADARQHVQAWLDEGNLAVVRINGAGTPWHDGDLAAVGQRATAIMVPKAEDPARLPRDVPVIPLIETAAGILNAAPVCAAPSTVRPAFGSVDLSAHLGVDHRAHEALRYARSALVMAAAAAGCGAPIDGVTTALDNEADLRADIEHAVRLGFTGKLCIHPKQVAAASRGFAPSDDDIAWARSVLEAMSDGSVAVRDGHMIDQPMLMRAKGILARA